MNAFVHPLKRKKPGRKKGPPTGTITFRVSADIKEQFEAMVPPDQRREWFEKTTKAAARRNGQRGGRPKQSK